MTAFLKGPIGVTLVFAFMGLGNVYGGFYDEVKLRAMQGDPEAQDILSYMYETGKGVPRDLNQARRWASLAERGGIGVARASPQRPRTGISDYSVRASPRRPIVNTVSYQQRPRLVPRRPANTTSQSAVRALPRRPAPGAGLELARAGLRGSKIERIDRGIRAYQRGRKWHQRVARGGKILVSPVTFTFKQSKRAVSKVARKAAFAGLLPY